MACMRKIEKPSPTESPLLFEFDPKPAEEMLTALGGLPLVVQAFRSLGLPGSVKQQLVVKERQRGYDEATFVESFVRPVPGRCPIITASFLAFPGTGSYRRICRAFFGSASEKSRASASRRASQTYTLCSTTKRWALTAN
jgi:hypothetical protein